MNLITKVRSYLYKILFILIYKKLFKKIETDSLLYKPFRIDGIRKISIGKGSVFQRGAWLYCAETCEDDTELEIGDGCVFGYNNHITSVKSVKIGNNVLTANNVYISDNIHGYEDINTPIINQPILFKRQVVIGCGTWLGENAVVIGAKIGKNCVIGANAVVTKDIPDYSVAVGVPAVVIKQFDKNSGIWVDLSLLRKSS
jgi:serine acetyltransferase